MAGEKKRIVLVPRYSSLVGSTTFHMAPINVRSFYSVTVTFWRGAGAGTIGSFTASVELSPDLRHWKIADEEWTISADTETEKTVSLDQEWMRLVFTIAGTDPAVPLWALGDFLLREG